MANTTAAFQPGPLMATYYASKVVPAVFLGAICLTALCLAPQPDAAAQTVSVPAFLVSSEGTSDFDFAQGSDGNLVFVWTEHNDSNSPPNWRVYSKNYSLQGSALTSQTRIDLAGRLQRGSLAATPTGFAAAFLHYADSGAQSIRARLLDPAGAGVGAFDEIATASSILYPGVASLPSALVFAWPQAGIQARLTSTSFEPLGPPFQVSATQVSTFWARVVALPGGGFCVVWRDSFTNGVYGRSYDSASAPMSDPFFVATGLVNERVAVSPTGEIAVAGAQGGEVWLYRVSPTGASVGPPILIADEAPATDASVDLEYDAFGDVFVVWSGYNAPVNDLLPVRMRLFEGATGQPASAVVMLADSGSHTIRVRHLADGRFANAWEAPFAGESVLRANIVSVCATNPPSCGNGVLDPPCESCDDGSANSDTAPDACRTTCHPAGCGDGVLDSNEECDDANRLDADGCDHDCLIEQCGNGRREGAEGCDDGNPTDADGCDSNCTVSACGNGVQAGAEECDDGNAVDGDGCDEECLVEQCGNGRRESNEECDDGNATDGDGCDSNCGLSRCGNGILAFDEECDDGNGVNGDGCDQSCLIEQCGNNRREGNEACDDGNAIDGDGCESSCTLTPQIDAALASMRPVTLLLSSGVASVSKSVRISVRNAEDTGLQVLRLTADDDTCPPGTVVGPPDFNPLIAGVQDSVSLAPGQRATATMEVRFARASLGAVHRNAPRRCRVLLSLAPNGGEVDGNPSSNQTGLVLDVFDRAAPEDVAEAYARSIRPLSLQIPSGLIAAERTLRVRARSTEAGASLAFAASDGDCPPGTISLTDVDPTAGTAMVRVRAARAFFTTPGRLSPNRCTASISTSAAQDTDAGNNDSPLVVDVIDQNDF